MFSLITGKHIITVPLDTESDITKPLVVIRLAKGSSSFQCKACQNSPPVPVLLRRDSASRSSTTSCHMR